MNSHKYSMTLGMGVLDHLGIRLYSNVPAVLSEVVANAWDADAQEVHVNVSKTRIEVSDNGHGMALDEINRRYLYVGLDRRSDKPVSEGLHRPVMGRKGIGKLSLFSIAQVIEIHTVRDGVGNALQMSRVDIEAAQKASNAGEYHPKDIPCERDEQGTTVILKDLRKRVTVSSGRALRTRIARRFSVIGERHKFRVFVDGEEVTVQDRDYYHKVQYLWHFGDHSQQYVDACPSAEKIEELPSQVKVEDRSFEVSGWIATAESSGDLNESGNNINKIVILHRGKVAQEDILEDFTEGGIFTKYIFGEINADFLDLDDDEDISTSSRQEYFKSDPRYTSLQSWVGVQLKTIKNQWTGLRNDEGTKQAMTVPGVAEWYKTLSPAARQSASKLFGKINQLTLDEPDKKTLFRHSIIAFEGLRVRENLEALDHASPTDLSLLTAIFSDLDDIEATYYHQIVSERLRIIDKLRQVVGEDQKERVIHEFIYKHLWLLDTSWERSTETPVMEERISKTFERLNGSLEASARGKEEAASRLDIRYKNPTGTHVVVELKRASVSIDSNDLSRQLTRYMDAVHDALETAGQRQVSVQGICILGRKCTDFRNTVAEQRGLDSLERRGIKVVYYDELIDNAYRNYSLFLERHEETQGRLAKFLDTLGPE